MKTSTTDAPALACGSCTGIAEYRVRFAQMPNSADNFEQLVDHRPVLFTREEFLKSRVAAGGQLTVWKLNLHDGVDCSCACHLTPGRKAGHTCADHPDTVIAYAGPDPNTGGRTWWVDTTDGAGSVAP